jgi:hypothetical protein
MAREAGLNVYFDGETPGQQTGGAGFGQPDISNHPEVVGLRNQVQTLLSYQQQQDQARIGQAAQTIVAEIATVRDEKDRASGQYLWPELHDDAFLTRMKPLVSALVGSVPNLSYGEAFKRAVLASRGQQAQPFGNSGQLNQARFQPPARQETRATTAAASVRGRTAPAVGAAQAQEIPSEALRDGRSTAMWALETLRRGA